MTQGPGLAPEPCVVTLPQVWEEQPRNWIPSPDSLEHLLVTDQNRHSELLAALLLLLLLLL